MSVYVPIALAERALADAVAGRGADDEDRLAAALDRLLAARPGRAHALVPGGRTGDDAPITPGRHIARRVLAGAGSLALVQALDLARELVRYLPARDVIGREHEGRAARSNGG